MASARRQGLHGDGLSLGPATLACSILANPVRFRKKLRSPIGQTDDAVLEVLEPLAAVGEPKSSAGCFIL
jgi:hypothetical protein